MSLEEFHLARAESKRRDIITAASRLFAARGFNDVSTATLAREAGVSSATLFKYFSDKESLFGAVLDSLIQNKILSLAASPSTDQDGLRDVCYRYADLLCDPTVLGLLRAIIADTKNSVGFQEKLEIHGDAIFTNEFETEIKKLLLESNPSQLFDLEQASAELRGVIEHKVLLPNLLFHERPCESEVSDSIEKSLASWKKHWLTYGTYEQ